MSLIKMIRESCEHKNDRKPVIFYYFYTWNDLVFHILVVNAKGVGPERIDFGLHLQVQLMKDFEHFKTITCMLQSIL